MAGLDSAFSNAGSAVSDLFAAKGFGFKAQGAKIEKDMYTEAAGFADENVEFTKASTAIKDQQDLRQSTLLLGGQKADVAGAGFAASGSALDLLRDSAAQGSLTRQVLGFQGQITEAGYEEQAKALRSQADAAGVAEQAAEEAQKGANLSAIIHGVSAVASIGSSFIPGGGGAPGGGGSGGGKGGG